MSRLLPILFNTDMVSRILTDEKSETRRFISPQPVDTPCLFRDEVGSMSLLARTERNQDLHTYYPPYNVGDILYVRETWQEVYELEYDRDTELGYVNIRDRISNFDEIDKVEAGMSRNHSSAQMPTRMKYYVFKAGNEFQYTDPNNDLLWRPSIHMPREAARIFLEVTDVDVQRVQDVTVDQILAEGVNWVTPPPICEIEIKYPESFPQGFNHWDEERREEWIESTARATYIGWLEYGNKVLREWEKLWNSTIPKKKLQIQGYDANPWVWVFKFRRWKEKVNFDMFPLRKR